MMADQKGKIYVKKKIVYTILKKQEKTSYQREIVCFEEKKKVKLCLNCV